MDVISFKANHHDGFTQRLLHYSVSYAGGVAELNASWFEVDSWDTTLAARFHLDSTPLCDALPKIQAMHDKYEADWTDLSTQSLRIELPGETLVKSVYGLGALLSYHPELECWSEIWKWIEETVAGHLPQKLELRTRPGKKVAMSAGAAAGAAAAAAAVAQAVRASGTLVRLEPNEFQRLIDRQVQPLVVHARGGFFTTTYSYLTSYKGLAFYTLSALELVLPKGTELIVAQSIWMPG